ncbi:proline-tRNA ligase [Perilla frutescens var. frutescens]|nr:proline-tRNA ligase [Perilla frutescens var. frutescens]
MNYLMQLRLLAIVLSQLYGYVVCKECTNTPTQLSSHTLRYELLTSKNETWKHEMLSSHYHLTPTDDSVWSRLFPRKMLKEEDELSWSMMYRKIKNSGGAKGIRGLLQDVSLHDVRLDPSSMHGMAQQTNLKYLLLLDVDRLVWSFRKTAGLDTPGQPYGGWESPEMQLRGHFVGHYMSATAQMWASTHNESLKGKMSAVVSALAACQQKIGTGYLSAFPSDYFDVFEAVKPVWAPYYTIHKILAGLLDQYNLAGNEQALKMTIWMVDYFYNRVQNVIAKYTIERHWTSLNEETGGMNDVLYKLYSITGDQKHLTLGHLFDKPCFLGLLAIKADSLSGFHANTHIPIVIGTQMRYELTGDPVYKEIGTFFMDTVNSSHSYATGGTSVSEFWSDPKRLAGTLQNETEESCTTYNMLKVSRHLFRWTKEMAYADYYERALTNGVLSIQRGRDPGIMIYMLPLVPGASKAATFHGWGTKYDSFWCCYGTGIESFSKLGDSIYFEEEGNTPTLYIIQYICSSLNWRSGGIVLNQQVEQVVSWDLHLHVMFTFTSREKTASVTSTLKFRIPLWTYSNGAKASLNGQDLPLPSAGNFLSVSRNWSPGDKITFNLPISLRTEAIKDERPEYASLQAIFYGPYLLAGLSHGDWDINAKSTTSFADWITPVPSEYNSQLISLSQDTGASIFFVSNSNNALKMETLPQVGTNAAVRSTFLLLLKDPTLGNFSKPSEAIEKLVMLEPFDFPGMAVVHYGEGKSLGIEDASEANAAVFRLVAGLDGKDTTVSLESEDQKGCFVCSGVDTSIKLSCSFRSSDDGFKQAASFTMRKGFNEYHPISFVAKGMQRNFLLSPLLSFMDESYTVYFNMHS